MIRRGFWLLLGAVTGIMGYRRVAAVGQQVSAKLSGTRLSGTNPREGRAPAALTARRAARGVFSGARGAVRFTRDVREGMDLYMDRHQGHPGSTLGAGQNSRDDVNNSHANDSRTNDSHTNDRHMDDDYVKDGR
jgi:hypothetical protein